MDHREAGSSEERVEHRHWRAQAVRRGDPPGWERVPAAEVFYSSSDGRLVVTGIPQQDDEDWTPADYERGHSCDEMGCGSIGPHVLIHADVRRPHMLARPPEAEGVAALDSMASKVRFALERLGAGQHPLTALRDALACVPVIRAALSAPSEPEGGSALIAAERRRQVEEEGWDATHDAIHDDGALAVIAAGLAVDSTDAEVSDPLDRVTPPTGDDYGDIWGLIQKHGYRGSRPDRVRALTIAGALIAAEIDRILPSEPWEDGHG